MYDLLIVDSPYLSHRADTAHFRLTSASGHNATMIHGFIRSLNSIRKKTNPSSIILTWESDSSWRKEMLPSYKEQRKTNTSYFERLTDLQDLLFLLKVKQYKAERNEADDVIATLVENNEEKKICIFTVDKDIMQLVTKNCVVFNGNITFTIDSVFEKFGVLPEQIPDLLALWGDTSDNIEGIRGYGLKKSASAVCLYNTIENIPEDILREKRKVLFNKKVATLNRKCALTELALSHPTTIDEILKKYGLNSIQKNLEEYKLLGTDGIESRNILS